MSGQIAHALEDAAKKAEKGLAKDFATGYHDILKETEQKTGQVADHVAENEAKTVEDIGKAGEHARPEVTDPHPAEGGVGTGAKPSGGDEPGTGAGREQVADPREAGRPDDAVCGGGEPVDMATGRMFIDQTDIALPGSLPLVFTRCFESGYQAGRWMGRRWVCTFDERLEIDDHGVVHLGADRRAQAYPHPEPGRPVRASAGAHRDLDIDQQARCYTLTDRTNGLTREFTAQPGGTTALLTRVRDRSGRHYDLAYDRDGAPTAITHSGGYRLLVTTESGRITEFLLAGAAPDGGDQSIMRYGYSDGHLSEVYNSSGLPMRFANDAWGRITSWTDRNDSHYWYVYDERGRVVDEGGADGSLRFQFAYGEADPDTGVRMNTETNALGHTTTYYVNQSHQISTVTDPLGNSTHFERDDFDRLLAMTDALGRTTRYEYDAVGDLIAVLRPDGEETTATYTGESSSPEAVTEPGGVRWEYIYDEAGRRTSLRDPVGAVTSYGYDEYGHLASVTSALGDIVQVRCNLAGLPTEVTDPTGATTRFQHDGFGRTVAVIDPIGGITRLTWTTEGHPLSRTGADNRTESWTYDGEGNLLAYTGKAGRVSTFEYTHFETLASGTGPDGSRYGFSYDANMQLVAVTNALGQTWKYTYDEAGRLIAEQDFQGRHTGYQLDPVGRMLVRTDPMGQEIRYAYDVLGHLTAKDAGGHATHYAYNRAGHLVRATGPDADVVRTVDALGNRLAETINGRTLTCIRDILGRKVLRTTPGGHTSAWEYDTVGRPTVLATDHGNLGFAYDPLGREQQRTYGEQLTLASTWDALNQLTSQTMHQTMQVTSSVRSSVLRRRGYSYDGDGNLAAVDDTLTGRRTFELDVVGRVTAVRAEGWNETYAYDRAGNLTEADWPTTEATRPALGVRTYEEAQLTTAGRIRYEYDAAGRVTLRQKARLSRKPDTWRYAWDSEGRLTGVTTPDGTRWSYAYDPFGRRIAKQRLGNDGTTVEEWTDFTWDGPTLAEQTTHAPYLPGPHTLSWDYDELHPLAQTETITTLSTVESEQDRIDHRFFAIITDLIGTPTELVDTTTGTVAWEAASTLWGNTTWPKGSSAYTPLRFPGQYFDPETRLHYNVNRYYDPETARYTSPDPLGLAPSANPDAYVHNPHTWSDPLGLSPHQHQDLLDAVKAEADKGSAVTPSRMRPVAAEGLKLPNGQITTSPSIRGAAPVLHADVKAVLDTVPADIRGDGHGKCGLPVLLSGALNSHIDPTGSAAAAAIIRSTTTHERHGFPIGPCKSCRYLSEHYNLDFITDDGK